jgi:hypothetical protein
MESAEKVYQTSKFCPYAYDSDFSGAGLQIKSLYVPPT